MLKKSLPVLLSSLLLAGCATELTNLTPTKQVRNTNNFYRVEAALDSRQQTIRWDSIHPQVVVGSEYHDMRVTPFMTNRWEGLIPIPPDTSVLRYHYKFEFQYNRMGKPGVDTILSPEYTLHILDQ